MTMQPTTTNSPKPQITAKMNGKQIGRKSGSKIISKKSVQAKEIIRKHSRSFGGTLNDDEVMKLAGVNRNSFYKYKKELREEDGER